MAKKKALSSSLSPSPSKSSQTMILGPFKDFTDGILKDLEKGTIPWKKPWDASHRNLFTRHLYAPINQLFLSRSKYKSRYWATRRELEEIGWFLKKDAKSFLIKAYGANLCQVFNLEELDGVTLSSSPRMFNMQQSCDRVEQIIKFWQRCNLKPIAFTGDDKACYTPYYDSITMPYKEDFTDIDLYYSTLLHELVHLTGHPSRLGRHNYEIQWQNHVYSKEELVAEIGSAQLRGYVGFQRPILVENSQAYIRDWMRRLKNHKDWLPWAAKEASEAVKYILRFDKQWLLSQLENYGTQLSNIGRKVGRKAGIEAGRNIAQLGLDCKNLHALITDENFSSFIFALLRINWKSAFEDCKSKRHVAKIKKCQKFLRFYLFEES